MSQKLYPTFDVPEVINEEAQIDKEYHRSMKWDPEKGDFVRDGSNRVLECDGREAFMIWCFKAAQTERYQCLAYPRSIGTEMESIKDNDHDVAHHHGSPEGQPPHRVCTELRVHMGCR